MPRLDLVSITLTDYDKAQGIVMFNVDEESTFADQETKLTALIAGVSAVTTGSQWSRSINRIRREVSTGPAPAGAQRGSKWFVRYQDITERFDATPGSGLGDGEFNTGYGRIYSVELPTADKTAALYNDTGFWTYNRVEETPAAWHTFVEAFEDVARSTSGGRVKILDIRHANRNT